MDLGRAEMGIHHRHGMRDLYTASVGFQPVNPFTSSIAQVTRNRQYPSRIISIDDVSLPRPRVPWRVHPRTPQPARPPPAQIYIRSSRHDHDLGPPSTPTIPPSTRSWITYIPEGARSSRHRSALGSLSRSDSSFHSAAHDTSSSFIAAAHDVSSNFHSAAYNFSSTFHSATDHPSVETEASSISSSVISRRHSINFSPSVEVDYELPPTPAHRPSSTRPPVNSSQGHNTPVYFANAAVFTSAHQEANHPSSQPSPQPASSAPSLSRVPAQSGSSRSSDARQGELDGAKDKFIPSPSTLQYQYCGVSPATGAAVTVKQTIRTGVVFATDILPRQLYLHFLLRLPSFYFSRVSGIFTEADLTLEEIYEMALQVYTENKSLFNHNMFETERYGHSGITTLSPAYERLKLSWEHFIDSLIKEWKTLNIISVLLLSAIMTTFQIHGATEDPVTRYLAFWSLICALMSLLYSCSFIIQFSSMRKAHKAVGWAIKTQTILWNVWVMLAMPMVWMTWSILTFIASIMSFMWRARANLPSDFKFFVAPSTELGFRIFVCVVLGLGVVYGALIISTFRRYGSQMDETWTRRVRNFIESTKPLHHSTTLPTTSQDWVNLRSMGSLPLHPPESPSSIAQPPITAPSHIISQTPPPFLQAPPVVIQCAASDYVPESIDIRLACQSSLSTHPQPGTQTEKPQRTQELRPRRSKSTPNLPPHLKADNGNPSKDTNPLFPGPQLYRFTSTPSHPIPSEDNNNSSLPKSVERKLRRSASDNLIRYSLTPHPAPVIKDPDNVTCSPPRPVFECLSGGELAVPSHRSSIDTFGSRF